MKKTKGILGCIVAFACALLIQLIVTIQVSAIFSIIEGFKAGYKNAREGVATNPEKIASMIQGSMSADVILIFQTIASLVCALIFGLWYYKKIVNKNRTDVKKAFEGQTVLWIILLAIGMQLGITIMMNLFGLAFPNIFDQYDSHMELIGTGTTFISFIYIILIAPISEEFIFRGVILNKGKKVIPFMYANILQALLFGIMHFNIVQGIYAFVLGLVIGIVYEKRQSILVPIVLHMIFNLSGIFLDKITGGFFETFKFLNLVLLIIPIPIIIISLVKLNKNPVMMIEENPAIEIDLEC